MKMTLLLVIFSLTFHSFSKADELPPAGSVRIDSFSHGGPGCPIGTVGSAISPDGSALSLLFDTFTASTLQGGTRDYKACTVDVRFTVPDGWSFAIFQTQVRGYAQIAATSSGYQRSRYTFGSRRLSVSEKEFRGPFVEDFLHDQSADPARLVFSPCGGGGRSLNILTSLEVQGAASLLTVDTIDSSLKQTYHMRWRRCSGGETIGPVAMTPNFSQVRSIDGDTGRDLGQMQPYDPAVKVGVQVAACDLNGDGVADLVTGTGRGAPPHVRVFDGRTGGQLNHPLGSFFAYATNFMGGVSVACGDIDGDGREDLITGAGPGGASHVIVRSGVTGQHIRSFIAYDAKFSGGVFVGATDLNADGADDIITGAGTGGGPHVKVYDGRTGSVLRGFFAYDPNFRGGVRVAGGDFNNDGFGDVLTGAGPGGGPHVVVYDGRTGQVQQSFWAYDAKFKGGVSVATADIDGDGVSDIIVGALRGGGPHVRVISGLTGLGLEGWSGSYFGFTSTFNYGINVAAAPASRRHTASIRRFYLAPASGSASPIR